MLKNTLTALVVLTISAVAQLAASDGVLARFDGAIGVDPVASVAFPLHAPDTTGRTFENVTRNVVRGVRPSSAIWRIADLHAVVGLGGRIRVAGRGLLLGGGDQIGQSLNLLVVATLICEAQAPFIELSSADSVNGNSFEDAVPLDQRGAWLAAGIPRFGPIWKNVTDAFDKYMK
ncbi:MAG: hypothetical protein ABI818_03785 [Acidobacteriota bacterium]